MRYFGILVVVALTLVLLSELTGASKISLKKAKQSTQVGSAKKPPTVAQTQNSNNSNKQKVQDVAQGKDNKKHSVTAIPIKQVFVKYSSRKKAKEAAKRDSGKQNPVSHGPHKPGQSPHYHHTGKDGKPTDYEEKHKNGKVYREHKHYQFPKGQG